MDGNNSSITHRVVEELLQLLVSVVDAELLKTIQIENLKTRNVQNSDEAESIVSMKVPLITRENKPGPLPLGPIQGLVDPRADPLEESLVGCFADGFNCKLYLLLALGLSHVISPN